MSTTYDGPLRRIAEGLDELAAISPDFRSTGEKQALLVGLAGLIARAKGEQLRVLAVAGDVAVSTGDRSTAHWLADQTRDAPADVRRDQRLADSLDGQWAEVGAALAGGDINAAQARVIVRALEELPDQLGDDIRAKAEHYLVTKAAEFGPRELRNLGRGILAHLAPEIADDAEYQRLVAQERRARADTKLSFRPRGDGSTDLFARLPDPVANRLRVYLDGYTSPRNKRLDARLGEIEGLPLSRRRGEAFCAMLEGLPASGLPRQGGSATNIGVVIDLSTLLADLDKAGIATTSTGDRITADQARRLACQAGIVPFVMSGKSVIHDQGRKQRLYSEAVRLALALLYPECSAEGCSTPTAWCEAHHKVAWSKGGKTRLEDGTLLCPFHHQRAHDPAWNVNYQPDGSTNFTRRQ